MNKIEKELNLIFEEHKQSFINVYDKNGGLKVKQENAIKFNSVFESLTDKLISKSNELLKENNNYSKTDVENIIKEKIKEFSRFLITPFE